MTTLTQFWRQSLAHGLPHAMGWTLLHFCWQGAVIAVLLWCVLGLLAGRSPRLRYLAACVALALTVLAPLATFAYLVSTQHALQAADSTIVVAAGMVLQVGANGPGGTWMARTAATLDHAVPWIMAAWFTGVVFFLGRLNAGFLIARRMRSIGTEAAPADLQAMFDELCNRLELSRPVKLLKSALVEVPTVIGWLRPVVLVPMSCFTGLSTEQIEAILSHELAHVRRHDYLVSVLQSVIEALLFYHPAVWWVSKQVRRERECCCDDMAVGVGGNALAYARALSYLEERRSSLPEVALGANGGVLTMRIKRLLGFTERSAASQLAAVMVLTLVVVAIATSIATMARAEGGTAARAARVVTPMELETPAALDTQIAAPPLKQLAAPARGTGIAIALAEPPSTPPPDSVPAASAPAGALKVSAAVMAGALVYKTDPVYPEIAKAAHVQGAVVMHAVISKAGTMENLQVISGPTMLQQSAMDAVKHWVYSPYLLNGQPMEVETTITVNYTFGEASGAPNSPPSLAAPVAMISSIAPPEGQAPQTGDPGMTPRRIGGSVSPPQVIYQVDPGYSEQARAAKFQGVVTLNLWVDQNGNPTHMRVLRGVGMGLDEKALEAVGQYKFKPAMENGKPVLVELNIEVNFRIFDPPKAQGQPLDRSRMSSVPTTVASDGPA